MKRRTFVETCLTASPGVVITGLGTTFDPVSIGSRKIPKTDTHVHLFDLTNLSYSWLQNAPEINRSFSIYDFQKASKTSNIGKILFMESGADAEFSLREATWVATLPIVEPRIKGIIAKLDLSQGSKTASQLEELGKLDILKGVRGPFPENTADPRNFMMGLNLLAERKLTFDLLLTPSRLIFAAEVIKKSPDTIFILDHFGNPDVRTGEISIWKKGIDALAALPNVNCKLSGIITKAGKEWTRDQLEPYVMYVIEQFGFDRLVYGGDWPVVLRAGSYRSWSKAFEKLTKNFAENELHKMYHENADRIYGI